MLESPVQFIFCRYLQMEVLEPPQKPPERVKIDLSKHPDLAKLSHNSRKILKSAVSKLNEYLGVHNFDFNQESLLGFLTHVRATASPSHFNTVKWALKKVLKSTSRNLDFHALSDALFKQPEAKSIKVDNRVQEQDYLTKDEATTLWRYGRDKNLRTKKLCLFVKFLFQTGCRLSEALSIRLKDIEINGHHAQIKIVGKRSKQRTAYCDSNLLDKIQTFYGPRSNTPTALLLVSERGNPIHPTSIQTALKTLATKVGLKKNIHPHTLRHSCAMYQLHEKKLDIKSLSEYLGHSDTSTTLNSYCHSMLSAEKILD